MDGSKRMFNSISGNCLMATPYTSLINPLSKDLVNRLLLVSYSFSISSYLLNVILSIFKNSLLLIKS